MNSVALLDRVGSYEIFNNLLPGVLFCFIVSNGTRFIIPSMGFFEDLFVFYFRGLIISRIGSLMIEKILRKSKFVKFANYADYCKASQKNKFIKTLSETNNTYRTLISLTLMVLLTKIADICLYDEIVLSQARKTIAFFLLCILVLVLFLFSYKKQTGYIKSRVEQLISTNEDSKSNKENLDK